jgi:DNA primase large subunit
VPHPASDAAASYDRPPLDDVTVEEFETWALERLRVLAEIESSFARNRPLDELKTVTLKHQEKYLTMDHTTARTKPLDAQRRKDHVSHFVLRLAFCRS